MKLAVRKNREGKYIVNRHKSDDLFLFDDFTEAKYFATEMNKSEDFALFKRKLKIYKFKLIKFIKNSFKA